jgi:hypothetical protein
MYGEKWGLLATSLRISEILLQFLRPDNQVHLIGVVESFKGLEEAGTAVNRVP